MKKIILALFLFSFFGYTHAQETTNFSFNHLTLSVKNLDESAAFYKDVLSLQEITNKTKIDGIQDPNGYWIEVNSVSKILLNLNND